VPREERFGDQSTDLRLDRQERRRPRSDRGNNSRKRGLPFGARSIELFPFKRGVNFGFGYTNLGTKTDS
jgi:hypothetical protein